MAHKPSKITLPEMPELPSAAKPAAIEMSFTMETADGPVEMVRAPLVPSQVTEQSLKALILMGVTQGWVRIGHSDEVTQAILSVVASIEPELMDLCFGDVHAEEDVLTAILDAIAEDDPNTTQAASRKVKASPPVEHHYLATLHGGSAGIYVSTDREAAKTMALADAGRDNLSGFRQATEDEVEWHKSMGGRVNLVDPAPSYEV